MLLRGWTRGEVGGTQRDAPMEIGRDSPSCARGTKTVRDSTRIKMKCKIVELSLRVDVWGWVLG